MRHVIVLLAALSLTACAADPVSDGDIVSEDEIRAARVLQAKLYAEPNASPSPSCDVHTAATLLKTGTGKLRLELENRVAGGCEIHFAPNKRTYTITQTESCGSKVYSGKNAADSVELRDHSARLCEDILPSILELRETRGGREIQLYGKPTATAPAGGASTVTVLNAVKLYHEPQAQPDAFCDKHTQLDLKRVGERLEARLEYRLSATSACDIFIAPNEKLFTVTESDDCGSKIYSSAAGASRVVIKDHSTRLCADEIPARIEVAWTQNGRTWHLFSTQ